MDVQIPTNSANVSLAQVEFNGSLYQNGSVLSPLISGYNYTFSVVNIAAGYDLDHWEVSNGTFGGAGIYSAGTLISFGCPSLPCPTVNLGVSLSSRNHALLSGEVYEANVMFSMSAAFTVSSVKWWSVPGGPAPKNGAQEIVNWGVGVGGVTDPTQVAVGLQIVNVTGPSGSFRVTYQPFWSTALSGWSGQHNFTVRV